MSRRDSAVVISTGAIRRALLALLLIVLVALAVVLGRQYLQRPPGVADQIDKSAYQAVWLTTGQMFMGHATVSDDSISLTDVFYLQPNTDTTQSQQVGQLIKRGSELTGPREPMLIELRQVLFVENMRDDSQVVQAIKRFKSGEQPAPTAAPTIAPAPTATARPSASR